MAEYISWTKITEPAEIVNNVKRVVLPTDEDNTTMVKDFIVIETIDGNYYFAGKFGEKDYIKWTPIETVLKEQINPLKHFEKDFSMRVVDTKSMFKNQYYPLFSFTMKNNFYAFDMTIIGNSDVVKCLISGNNRFTNIYTDYSVTPKNNIELCVSKANESGLYVCYIKFSNDDFFSVSNFYEHVKIIVNNIHSENFTYFRDGDSVPEYSTEEPISAKTYPISTKGYFGSSSDSKNSISVPYNANEEFYMINISVDIGKTKIYIDGNYTYKESENKEIIPYEDSKYKGPQFLYPIFYNLGIPFNQFIKFEGYIIVDGTLYPVNYVKISEPGVDTTKFGVVQFLLDSFTKLDKTPDLKDDGVGNIFGITFYPIINNENGEYSYQVLNNIENSVISQNSCEKNIAILENSFTNIEKVKERVLHTDRYFILLDTNKIVIYDYINELINIELLPTSFDLIKELDDNHFVICNKDENDENCKVYYKYPFMIDEKTTKTKLKETYTDLVFEASDINVDTISENSYEIKFDNDEYYYRIKNEDSQNNLYLYKDHMSLGQRNNNTDGKNIIPSTIQALDGFLMFPKKDVREEQYPKSFSF